MLTHHIAANGVLANPAATTIPKDQRYIDRILASSDRSFNRQKLSAGSPLLKRIAEQVCEAHWLSRERLMGDSRRQWETRARQEFMWRAYQTGQFSLPTIGRFLGRDHTTVLWGVRAHQRRLGKRLSPAITTGQVRAGDDASSACGGSQDAPQART